jgi:hypothetical protein
MHNLSTIHLETIPIQLPTSNHGLLCESLDEINDHQLYAGIVNVTEKVGLDIPHCPGPFITESVCALRLLHSNNGVSTMRSVCRELACVLSIVRRKFASLAKSLQYKH